MLLLADRMYDLNTSRGLYSLSSKKTYNIELPEAAGKVILGTSKGWLLTLGRDFEINLLHPLLRLQFSLPPMLMFPMPYAYEKYAPRDTEQFIHKVAMSSKLLKKNTDALSPIVMAVYGKYGKNIGFAKLGDKVWTDVNVPSNVSFHSIVYHKGNFYVVDIHGNVYVCCIDHDKEKGGSRGTKIASIKYECNWEQKFLVETLSGSGLLLCDKSKLFKRSSGYVREYHTTNFAVWRLDLKYYDSLEIPSCTLKKVKNLGNEAIFVGRASSLSVSSSEFIKPNSIYFTDDNRKCYLPKRGGHENEMGIFDMERRTIEPHFEGKSIHCISPPLWYI